MNRARKSENYFEKALVHEANEEWIECVINYLKSIYSGEDEAEAYLNLGSRLWDFQDFGMQVHMGSDYDSLISATYGQWYHYLKTGCLLYPNSADLLFWLKYISALESGKLGDAVFSVQECSELVLKYPETIIPYHYFAGQDGFHHLFESRKNEIAEHARKLTTALSPLVFSRIDKFL